MDTNMNLEEKISYIQKLFPTFDKKVIYDVDKSGNEFCEIIMTDRALEGMPIALNISELGCILSVGQFHNITGDKPIPVSFAIDAINDVINDKIIFVLAWRDNEDIGMGKPYLTQIFALTGDKDDMSEEYENFIEKISTPLSPFRRKLTRLKGRFVIASFSGAINKTIIR